MTTLDLSNHDYSTFDPDCLKASGVDRVIVGCWDLGVTLDIVARSRAAAIIAEELYCFLYPGLAWEQREVTNAVEVQRQLGGIAMAWPDCESQFTEWPGDLDTEAVGMTVDGRLAALRRARATLTAAGMRLGTYTGESYWRSMYGNSSEFAADPLWLANYGSNDPNNPRPPITTVAFGGWSAVYRHQYSSTIAVCGRNRDHNYDLEEEDMTPEEFERLFDKRFEERLAARFPNYLAAAFEEVSYRFSDRDDIPEAPMHFPYKPWLDDLEAARCGHATLPGVARD